MSAPSPSIQAPRASILVPTCGRERELLRCLDALTAEIAQSGIAAEILTIHAPGDALAIAAVRARCPAVTAIDSPRRNLSFQRNLGARAARGEILVYFDDDAWPNSGWLRALLAPFEDPRLAAAGGLVLHPDGEVQYGRMGVTRSARPIPLQDDDALPKHVVPLLPGGNLAIRRAALFEIGGFDENLAYHFDDVELALRLARERREVAYASRAAIFHESAAGPHRRTWFDRDWYTVAKNGVYVGLKHGPRTPLGLLAPALLQIPKSLRLIAWGLLGRLPLHRALRAVALHAGGIAAGYAKAACLRPCLPLAATIESSPAVPRDGSGTPRPTNARARAALPTE